MSAPVAVGVGVLAGLREPEEARNVEALVLGLVTPGGGALGHADLEVPSLLVKALDPLVRPVARRRRVLGGARAVVVRQLGHLHHAGRRHRLHPVGRQITRELIMVFGVDEIIQVLTQQFVLRNTIPKFGFVRVSFQKFR